jgi:hypothetical protein
MLYLIIYYLVVSVVCLWVGLLFYSFFTPAELRKKSLAHFQITGLIVLTALGQWIVLFLPVNGITLLFILLLLGFISAARKKRVADLFRTCMAELKSNSGLFYLCLFCFLIMILVLNAGPIMMDDTDSYHIQMVKWVSEYGSVPGIANLHLRFGFNSSWFISIALFNFPAGMLNGYACLNGLLSLWLCYFLLETFFDSIRSKVSKQGWLSAACLAIFALCLLNWPMIRGSATNSNYDFITTCCIIILFVDLKAMGKTVSPEWLLWPVYLFSVRMINFPLLILSVIFFLRFIKPFSGKKISFTILTAGFVIIPFLIRNIILSGYVFFPVYQLDFFSFDWKADKMKLVEISRYIKYFNRVNPMYQPMSVTDKLEFPGWILSWYKYLFRFDRLVLSISFLGFMVLFFRLKKIGNKLFKIFLATMICQFIAWFFISPDPRFVYGPLLFGIFAAISTLPDLKRYGFTIMKYSLVAMSILFLEYVIVKGARNDQYRNFLTPHPVPVPAIQTVVVNHIPIHIPERILNNWNPRCYDIDLPCLYTPDPRLEARGTGITDGFRLKNTGAITTDEFKITE